SQVVDTAYSSDGGRVVNRGIPRETVAARTNQRIETVKVQDAQVAPGARVRGETRNGNTITAFRPNLAATKPVDPPTALQRRQERIAARATNRQAVQARQQDRRENAQQNAAAAQQRAAEARQTRQVTQQSNEAARERLMQEKQRLRSTNTENRQAAQQQRVQENQAEAQARRAQQEAAVRERQQQNTA